MTAPLYAKVKDHILDNIRSGEWQPGARVPSENELVAAFNISRMTANRALRELTAEGLLARVPGVGTFVKRPDAAAPARSSLLELRNIAEEITSRGHAHAVDIETREEVISSPELTERFEFDRPGRLFHLLLVHSENGLPVQIEDRYVNTLAAPFFFDQDFTKTTPTAYLVSAVPVDELEHTVEAVMPDPQQGRLLDVEDGEPCLALHRRSWSKGRVVTVATLLYPATRYALHSRYRTSAAGTLDGRG
jgi:GntR family histidine utilization transcriptional repressor